MCTAISYLASDHYFGRNLDLEYSYSEAVTITPRKFELNFRRMKTLSEHYAIIGMATISKDYPLYYDATNEHGLSIAALNFPGNAVYFSENKSKDNVTPFELIPWILAQCKNLSEAREKLENVNLLSIPFSQEFALTPLHWLIADKDEAIVLESTANGISVYNNTIGVLTNNPPFDFHINNLQNYLNLTSMEPTNRFASGISLTPYSRGMGAIGLPGDLSSASRFVRAAFVKLNSISDSSETSNVSQFFHILGSVEQQRGCVNINGNHEITVYSSCCNTNKGIYYYRTYENSQITAVNMFKENLSAAALYTFPLILKQQFRHQN